jgi:isopentenyl diphosphate isomerase/L-lactate dehydrogenase-like FMN-dependent dehydrogenase
MENNQLAEQVTEDEGQILAARKSDHIRINLEEDVASRVTNGLERYRFMHQALPELDVREIDTSLVLFKKALTCAIADLLYDRRHGTGAAD